MSSFHLAAYACCVAMMTATISPTLPLILAGTATLTTDPSGVGAFIALTTQAKASARQVFVLGSFSDEVTRWTCCRRYEPYWMVPAWGQRADAVPRETQYLLAELSDGRVGLIVPLIEGAFRCSLEGYGGELYVVAESGDPSLVTSAITGIYVAIGADAHALMPRAAEAAMARMQTGRLRRDKALPAFADQFGWCTWDAFYQEVDADKVRAGLESFRAAGVPPKLLILDDGWQSERTCADGARRLTSLAPNAKFGGDLAPTVRLAKDEFGVDTFLVWHAYFGYWGGIDGDALPAYGVRNIARDSSPGIRHYSPTHDQWFGPTVGVPDVHLADRFYHDYHRRLRQMGVDGVKVDVQATAESVAAGQGGRVAVMQRFHEALEGSAQTHFRGNLINCMSCASEMFYGALNSTLTRTSTDFWPKQPETHGKHLATNAWVGMWFGEFCHPDWDMFQSGHPAGPFHAAGRAVSGAPIYVSDKPGEHNVALLRKLVFSDGSTARCHLPGRPSRDCLFRDPLQTDVLLKIINTTSVNAVVGVFNARYHADVAQRVTLSGRVTTADVPGVIGETICWTHTGHTLTPHAVHLTLPELTAEVVTIARIERGFAPIGLTSLFCPGAGISNARWIGNTWTADVRDGGEFLAWMKTTPRSMTYNGIALSWEHNADGGVRLQLPQAGQLLIEVSTA